MSELTKEKIYKRELLKKGATGNNNLERIRSLQNGGSDASAKLESARMAKRKKHIVGGWTSINWKGYMVSGDNIWTDGDNIYYSNAQNQYVLDKEKSTWKPKVWKGLTIFSRKDIWTDGDNIYYTDVSIPYVNKSYVLNKQTSTWEEKKWEGITLETYYGREIWTDGENIYLGQGFVLNKEESRWYVKEFGNAIKQFDGHNVWTDGHNIYYSGAAQYVLNQETSTWNGKSWGDYSPEGKWIWTDGDNIYESGNNTQRVLDFGTGSWVEKNWGIAFIGDNIWTDGKNIYLSEGRMQYVLELQKSVYVNP